MPLLMWYSGIMKAGGKGKDFRECSTSSLPLPPPTAFHLLSPFFCSTHYLISPAGVRSSGALWQSRVKAAHQPHKLTIVGSTPASATTDDIVNTPLFFQQKYLGNSRGISVIFLTVTEHDAPGGGYPLEVDECTSQRHCSYFSRKR